MSAADEADAQALLAGSCPAPAEGDRVTLAHGAGAGASARLFDELLAPRLGGGPLDERHDSALLDAPEAGARLAFTTDSFVVSPLEFPGGDIGSLAVHGTLNDLAMSGARPRALSCGLILEEGLPLTTLARIAESMGAAARTAGVPIATGDTKVVERGKGDGIFVNTSGVGVVSPGRELHPKLVVPGDVLILTGSLGCHGAAVLCAREGLSFDADIMSDSEPLPDLVENLLEAVPEVHCLRDPTRGGLGALVHEIAAAAGVELRLEEAALPVDAPVASLCEILGLDPLFLACEGRFAAFVPEAHAGTALAALRSHPLGRAARCVGRVEPSTRGRTRVVVETRIGATRLLPLPAGEPLPRIC
ncbi:MAG: hydrogenase expression/formation protein HypE [bacterium]|nr:hydrogenase expression/formation protein HypE [bacterium]